MTEAVLAFRAVPGGERDIQAVDTSDESLLARVARGDDDALGDLYDRFGGVAYGLALRILRDEPLAPETEPTAGSTAEAAELRGRREAVQRALMQLPEEQRRPIELAYYGGFSQSELAERLGEPLGTIKSRMFTGLKRLRELLGTEV